MKVNNNISIENARLMFRNFEGKEGTCNAAGKRNFCVLLDEEDANEMMADGWNVKFLQPKEEGDNPLPFIQVSVNFNNIPPRIVLISGSGKTILDAESVSILDWAEIDTADLIIKPYNWEVNGKSGIKAYCKALYVKIVEDEFESKYYDVPDSAASSMMLND